MGLTLTLNIGRTARDVGRFWRSIRKPAALKCETAGTAGATETRPATRRALKRVRTRPDRAFFPWLGAFPAGKAGVLRTQVHRSPTGPVSRIDLRGPAREPSRPENGPSCTPPCYKAGRHSPGVSGQQESLCQRAARSATLFFRRSKSIFRRTNPSGSRKRSTPRCIRRTPNPLPSS